MFNAGLAEGRFIKRGSEEQMLRDGRPVLNRLEKDSYHELAKQTDS